MSKQNTFIEYIMNDLFANMRGITHRAMFGGYGIYKNNIIFALVAYDKLYFKVDDTNRAEYEALGSKPFTYARKNHPPTTMSYWELPVEIMEDQEKLKKWINKSYQISKKKKSK